MKNEEVKNMDFGAERRSVVQNQGSRGSGAERKLHWKMMKNQWKIHPKIHEKSMQIDARKSNAKIMKNERKWSPQGSQNPLKNNKNH